MKNWFLHILLLAGLFGMLTTSCSQDEEVMQTGSENESHVQLRFTIVMDDSPTSRTWGGNYEAEVAAKAENAINNIQVLLFSSDGATCYGALENVQYFSVDELDKVYEFQGSIPLAADNSLISNANKLNCKIMVLANCSIPANTANTGIAAAVTDLTYIASQIYSSTDGLKAGIPMWGITTVSNLNVEQGWATSLPEDIYMLRSMAKIRINLSDKVKQYGFTLAPTLSKYNPTGYCQPTFPTLASGQSLPANTKALSQEGCLRANMATPGTNLAFMGNATDGYYAYIPEFAISLENNVTNAVINLGLLKKGQSTSVKTTTLQFRNYVNGKPTGEKFNIVRNHIYDYTINNINDGYNMELTCVVKDWILVEESWVFTDQVTHSAGGDLVCTTEDAVVYNEDTNKPTGEIVTKGGDLNFTFKLDTPTDATWTAEFIPLSGDSEAFVFVTGEGIAETVSGQVGQQASLNIKPKNTNITQNNSALLRISVKTKDDRTIVVKDLLPDAFGEVKEYTITHSI